MAHKGGAQHAQGVIDVLSLVARRSHLFTTALAAAVHRSSARGEDAQLLRSRLEEAERIRVELIATVTHEFRTPITGIRGAALTLLKHGDRLDPTTRQRLLYAVLENQERLFRTLENMLVAAAATPLDPLAVAEVDAVSTEVAMLAGPARSTKISPAVLVAPGTLARIDRQALHLVLANLVSNAQEHGRPGAVPIIAGGVDAGGVWLTVSNEATGREAEQTARWFEPFTQATGGATRSREGIGMGLYVVRRLVEAHGGQVRLRSTDGWVSVQVRLANARVQCPMAEPTL